MRHHRYAKGLGSVYLRFQDGFSLIELLLVLVVTSLLITIAVPSYQAHVLQAKRVSAQGDLLALSGVLERYYLEHYSYLGATLGADSTLPFSPYSPSSEPEQTKQFDLAIEQILDNGEAYILKASPVKVLADQGQGALYYFSSGQRAWDRNNNGILEPAEYCWRCE